MEAGKRYRREIKKPCPAGGFHSAVSDGRETRCEKCGNLVVGAHEGPQSQLLVSEADIVIFGGAKGGGKSYGLLLETARHQSNAKFGAVVFRRESPQIFNLGGLWDTSEQIYPALKARPVKSHGEWIFPSGARVRFAHLEYEKDVRKWDGQQVPLIGFDELTLFTEKQFWYMLTINRSTCGVAPYIRATCNPDADSWVAKLIAWWIDPDTGYAIPERSGIVRWFVRVDGRLHWADHRKQLVKKFPKSLPKSFTFIRSLLEDNPTLEAIDPGYRANLMAQEIVEQERLVKGNWKIRPAAGLKFPRDRWWRIGDHDITVAPKGMRLCRFWDKAATEGGTGARTAGVLVGKLFDYQKLGLPEYWIVDAQMGRWGDAEREARIVATAALDQEAYGKDGGYVSIGMETEPGSGGKFSTTMTIRSLAGYDVFGIRPTGNKSARWTPLAAQQQIGNVGIVKGPWDWAEFIRELDALAGDENLDKGKLKDNADAASGAFQHLCGNVFNQHSELIVSGDGDKGLLTDKDLKEMPDFWQDLIKTQREMNSDQWNDKDWQ